MMAEVGNAVLSVEGYPLPSYYKVGRSPLPLVEPVYKVSRALYPGFSLG